MRIFEVLQSRPSPATRRWFSGSKVVDDQGNPLPVYHGTNQPIDKFDVSRKGMTTSHSTALKGFFFTDSPAVASDYAAGAGNNVRADVANFEKKTAELKLRVDKLERIAQRSGRNEDWQAHSDAEAEWESLEIDSLRADPSIGQNVIPVYLKIINPLVLDAKGNSINDIEGTFLGDAIDTAKRDKRDGLIIHNLNDTPTLNLASTQYVVFSQRQIRSVFS
jgi:hypothetical protein